MKRVIVLAAALVASSAAFAQPPAATKPAQPTPAAQPTATSTLKAGDKAPALAIESWVKGEPVTGFEKGKIYVVEFWATWCPPCRESIPHLTELQKEYKSKNVTIIGVDVWEDARGTQYSADTLPKVKKFVEEFGDKMNYTVAYDGPNKPTDKAYMKAAKQNGIPTAFIVDGESKIAWIGSPFEIDPVLEHVVKGTWNETTRQNIEKTKKDEASAFTSLNAALKSGDSAKVLELGPKVVEKMGTNAQAMNELSWGIVDPKGKFASKLKDEPKLVALAFDAAEKSDKASQSKNAAFLDTFARCYWVKGDKAKAIELQKKAVSLADAQMKSELEESLKEYEGK